MTSSKYSSTINYLYIFHAVQYLIRVKSKQNLQKKGLDIFSRCGKSWIFIDRQIASKKSNSDQIFERKCVNFAELLFSYYNRTYFGRKIGIFFKDPYGQICILTSNFFFLISRFLCRFPFPLLNPLSVDSTNAFTNKLNTETTVQQL